MKVYGAPEGITLTPDYRNYDRVAERAKEDEYKAAIKAELIASGYTGPHTGEIASFGHADGYAQYMFADKGRSSCLIHLNIGDAWDSPLAHYMPKTDVLKQIERDKGMKAIFANR